MGKAITIITAKTSIAQAKIGILPSVMPGARVRKHADDDLDRAGNGADLDEADPEQPEIGVDPRRISDRGQRRIHEPAAVGREPDEERGEERQPADEIGPEGIGRQPREGQVARGEHLRQQQHAHRLDRRHREQEHHHRAVHGEELVVGVGRQELHAAARQAGRASPAPGCPRAGRTANAVTM